MTIGYADDMYMYVTVASGCMLEGASASVGTAPDNIVTEFSSAVMVSDHRFGVYLGAQITAVGDESNF